MLKAANRRVCIVNPFEHGGGAEYQIGLLADALASSGGYEVHYLAHFLEERARSRSYRAWRIGNGGPIPRLGYLMEARALYRTLREIDPCVIYQRVACGYTGICARYARRRAVPLVWHISHDAELSSEPLDRGRNVVRSRLERWSVEYGIRRADRIVAQTQRQAQLLQRNYGREAAAVIPNFHPLPPENIDKQGPLTVIWIANLKPWKQPAAFVRLANRLRGQDVRFIMIGACAEAGGNDSWQRPLLRDIDAAPNLSYLGPKSQEEVNALLAGAHIFVNTSLHEGFPNTFIQAWLRDVAVVSLHVDPDDVLQARGAGILARTEDGLADAVRELLDPRVRMELVRRGREHALERHSMRNAEELIGLLACGGRPASTRRA
jgi:glycosyltransferase involved in cell wall biosynthesis